MVKIFFNLHNRPYWAGIPGNAADFPSEESFYTFIEPALCFFTQETNYQNSPSPFGIKMADRLTGKPIHLDISDLPMKQGIITNRNKFILGPSGSGKSFFTNHIGYNHGGGLGTDTTYFPELNTTISIASVEADKRNIALQIRDLLITGSKNK